MSAPVHAKFRRQRFDFPSFFFAGLTGLATLLIVAILAVILGNVVFHGWEGISWRFITAGTEKDMFDVDKAGVLPMIFGTTARVILMTGYGYDPSHSIVKARQEGLRFVLFKPFRVEQLLSALESPEPPPQAAAV